MKEHEIAPEEDMADECLWKFSYEMDLLHKDAWHAHCNYFQPSLRLFSELVANRVFNLIKEQFLLHFLAFRLLTFSKHAQ